MLNFEILVVLVCHRKKLLYIAIILLFSSWALWLHHVSTRESNEPGLEHFRRSRNLSDYMNGISLLAEPTTTPCESLNDVPLIVLVASTPARSERRDTIRATWGPLLPTYFLLGLKDGDENVENINLEAYQYNDLIVYDFQEHYQNLTLKTALMLKWTQDRCPYVTFLLKTDDDILVNPWIMSKILIDNINAQLIGFKYYNVWPYRGEYDKWYLPRWLYKSDFVPQYLLGAGYLIKGEYIEKILDAAAEVPLINIEDIYFTYLVARAKLGLELTHEPRMSPYPHWSLLSCAYWPFAITHGLRPQDSIQIWDGLVDIAADYKNNKDVCEFYNTFSRLAEYFYT